MIPKSDVYNIVKNTLSTNTELSKTTLFNSTLPPIKILDIYSNVNKINREKDENNFKMQESDCKKINVDKQTSENVDTDVKLNTGELKDEQKSQSKFQEWYAINSIVLMARKDVIELMEELLREKHIVLNTNFTLTHSKTGINIDINDFLGVYL